LELFASLEGYIEIFLQNYIDNQHIVDGWGAQMNPGWDNPQHDWQAGQLYGLMTQILLDIPGDAQVSPPSDDSDGQNDDNSICGSIVYTAYLDGVELTTSSDV
jgi:hypothetical protein